MSHLRYRRILLLVAAIVLGVTVLCVAQNSSRPLTNDDVIRMVQEKVDEDVIMRAISTSEINFDISPNGLIQLKKGKVKKRIIEAIQSAQLSKNNSRASSGNSSVHLPAFGESESTPTSIPSPTPKPTPVATQYAEFFKFDLERCSISGTTVICYFKITNTAQDRLLQHMACMTCYPGGSELIDDVGGTTRIRDYNIGISGSGAPSYEANILTNASIKAWFKFDGVSSEAQKIGRLTLALSARPGGEFRIQFRDIPLARPRGGIVDRF